MLIFSYRWIYKVTDKDAAVYTRKIALEEGIFVGNSAGACVKDYCN
jgi:cysteine synthase